MCPNKTPHPRGAGQPHGVRPKIGSHPASLANVTVQRAAGPGQTWMNLTKEEVEKYQLSQPQRPKPGAGPSLLSRVAGLFKRKSGPGS